MTPSLLAFAVILCVGDSLPRTVRHPRMDMRKFTGERLLDNVKDDQLTGSVSDLFTDSPQEVITPKTLISQGPGIPKWLTGTLFRNGPGLFNAQEQVVDGSESTKNVNSKLRKFDHVFDGLAKITRYHFAEDNSVHFSARFIDSTLYKAMMKGEMPAAAYAGPVNPPFSTVEKIKGMVGSAFDNAPVNVHQVGGPAGPLVAMTDFSLMMQFDPQTLETKGEIKSPSPIVSFGGIETFSTAHPHYMDGFSYNLFTELRPVPLPFCEKSNIIHLVRSDSDLKRESIGCFATGGSDIAPYIHDFGLSQNHAIVCVWPARWNMEKSLDNKGMMKNMMWVGDTVNTKIYVFDLKNPTSREAVAEFEAPPMFAYHHINAYEESKEGGIVDLVVDFSGYDALDIANGEHPFALITNIMDPVKRKLQTRDARQYRLRLPLPQPPASISPAKTSTSDDAATALSVPFLLPSVLVAVDKKGRELTFELPRMDPRKKAQKHRYSYGFTGFADVGTGYSDWALVKLDHHAAEDNNLHSSDKKVTSLTWESESCFPSEAIFVPNPTDPTQEEDSGVLLSQVYDGVRKETFLLVLDAQNMQELGRYYTGMVCPISFHGQFVMSGK